MDINLIVVAIAAITLLYNFAKPFIHKINHKRKLNSRQNEYTFCSLCSKMRRDTNPLVAGKNGAVCSECLIDGVVLLDSKDDSSDQLSIVDKLIVQKLDVESSEVLSQSYLSQSLLEKCRADSMFRSLILSEFLTKRNFVYPREIISHIPPDQWRYFEILNWIWANTMMGWFKEALQYPEPIKQGDQDVEEINERRISLNRISVLLELDQSASNVNEQLSKLNVLKEDLDSSEYPINDDYAKLMPYVLSNMALCHYLLGNYQQALETISKVQKLRNNDSFTELLLGNIHEKQGDVDKAKAHWQEGLEIESRGVYATRLREKLGV